MTFPVQGHMDIARCLFFIQDVTRPSLSYTTCIVTGWYLHRQLCSYSPNDFPCCVINKKVTLSSSTKHSRHLSSFVNVSTPLSKIASVLLKLNFSPGFNILYFIVNLAL